MGKKPWESHGRPESHGGKAMGREAMEGEAMEKAMGSNLNGLLSK